MTTGTKHMNERPTPETDAMVEESFHRMNFPTSTVPAEFAKRLERERDELKEQLDAVLKAHDERCMEVEDAKRALGAITFEGIRMASMRVKDERNSLQEQLDAAIMLGKMQERRHERELEQVREQYRLSSVCRELKAENEKLKQKQP